MSGFDLGRFDPPLTVPTLVSGPVLLRPFDEGDATLVMEASRDTDIVRVTSLAAACSLDDGRDFVARQHVLATEGHGYSFALCPANQPERAIGSAALWLKEIEVGRARMGYWLLEPFRGAGLAMAGLSGVVQFAFEELAIPSLDLFIEPDNAASVHTAQRVGFTRGERLVRWERIDEHLVDVDHYGLERESWTSP